MCLHLDLVQSWASQGVPVLRTSTISMIQAGSRRRKCPWSYCPKVSLGLKGMQSLALHECRLCIKFRPSVFISALPHHPLCVVVLPRPRKGLFDWSLCPRSVNAFSLAFPFLRCSSILSRTHPLTSGKSTQKAFIFRPYKKLAKLSPNRDKLSCMSCRCMKFASRSAILSESSAKAGSREDSGEEVL
jgi:hypothetical protein